MKGRTSFHLNILGNVADKRNTKHCIIGNHQSEFSFRIRYRTIGSFFLLNSGTGQRKPAFIQHTATYRHFRKLYFRMSRTLHTLHKILRAIRPSYRKQP